MPPVLVSACLVGVRCRYDGGSRPHPDLCEQFRQDGSRVVPVCPEQLGGLPTPRPAAEITTGDGHAVLEGKARVVDVGGADVTEVYVRGAEEAVRIARLAGCRRAWFKEKSPACGVRTIRRGGEVCPGAGVAAALLQSSGVEVIGV